MSRTEKDRNGNGAFCDRCAVVDRRHFLLDVGVTAASVLVALGATPHHASAAPMEFISAIGGDQDDKAYLIPAKDGTQIDRDAGVIVTRWQAKVYVFSLACPHQNTAIRWHDADNQFECPKHHSRYMANGVYVKDSGRATRGLDRFAVRKDGNTVVANLDKLYQEDEDEAAWTTSFISL